MRTNSALIPFCGLDLVKEGVNSYSDIDTVIGEDQSRVGGGEFGVRHFEVLENSISIQ